MITFGFDPSLRHGSLIIAQYEPTHTGQLELRNWDIVFQWKKEDEISCGMEASPNQLNRLVSHIIKSLESYEKAPIATDWTSQITFRSSKLQQVKMSYLIGYFNGVSTILERPLIFISPPEVRKKLKLANKSEKTLVHLKFFQEVIVHSDDQKLLLTREYEDTLDSLILAYILAASLFPR